MQGVSLTIGTGNACPNAIHQFEVPWDLKMPPLFTNPNDALQCAIMMCRQLGHDNEGRAREEARVPGKKPRGQRGLTGSPAHVAHSCGPIVSFERMIRHARE